MGTLQKGGRGFGLLLGGKAGGEIIGISCGFGSVLQGSLLTGWHHCGGIDSQGGPVKDTPQWDLCHIGMQQFRGTNGANVLPSCLTCRCSDRRTLGAQRAQYRLRKEHTFKYVRVPDTT